MPRKGEPPTDIKQNDASNSNNSKSEVSKVKGKKSFIPLRQPNPGYLGLHHHQQQQQKQPAEGKPSSSKACDTSLYSVSSSSDRNKNVTIATFKLPACPESQESSKISLRSGRNNELLERNPRSILSSSVNSKELLDTHPTNNNSTEGLHLNVQCDDDYWKKSTVPFNSPIPGSNDFLKLFASSTATSETCLLTSLFRKVGKVSSRTRGYFLCPICNEPLNYPSIIACGHVFCTRCVSSWLEGQENCPCCRYHIAGRDAIEDSVVTRDFRVINPLLASIFNAGNFFECFKDEFQTASSDCSQAVPTFTGGLQSCDISAKFLSRVIAPAFRELFAEKKKATGINEILMRKGISGENHRHNFLAAIWLTKQVYRLQMSKTKVKDSQQQKGNSSSDECDIAQLPLLIRLESSRGRGNEASRESLLKQVMSMKYEKLTNNSQSFVVPAADPSGKFMPGGSRQARIRFRRPTLRGIFKMIVVTTLYALISLMIYICDDHPLHRRGSLWRLDVNKMDLLAYSFFIFIMITYTETDRIVLMRRRSARARRRRRNRPDPAEDFILT